MKLNYVLNATLLLRIATALTVPRPLLLLDRIPQGRPFNLTGVVDVSTDWAASVQGTVNSEEKWATNVARGKKLLAAMKGSDAEAAAIWKMGSTAKSEFDGDLKKEMEEWGWNDDPEKQKKELDKQCDFVAYHKIGRCFEALGLGSQSKGAGGPNECFTAEHWDGPTVEKNLLGRFPKPKEQRYKACGTTKLWVTEGYYRIGINAAGGAIMALDRKAPAHGAEQLWGRKPKDYELPQIRSASDVTWAFWNRATVGYDIKNIKYFFNCWIVNEETQELIRMAHEKTNPPRSAPGTWPGTEFSMDGDQGLALLGSPLGRSHGFFLIQHKEGLGGSKFISTVRVFKNDAMTMPYMVFYVEGPSEAGDVGSGVEALDVLQQLGNGANLTARAKL